MSADAQLWRKRRIRCYLITRLPRPLAWKLLRFATTPEQAKIVNVDFQTMITDVLSSCEQPTVHA